MSHPRILQLTTFPIDPPDSGGKLRCFKIREALRSKFEVETLSFHVSDLDRIHPWQIDVSLQGCLAEVQHTCLLDWGIFPYLFKKPELLEVVASKIKNFKPGILWCEQPYAWELVVWLQRAGVIGPEVQVVYSSHNHESKMKKAIYESVFAEDTFQKNFQKVEALESGMIASCDWALGVLLSDIEVIRDHQPQKYVGHFVNGHSRPVHLDRRSYWNQIFNDTPGAINWVHVGSAHPPNINSFMKLLSAFRKLKSEGRNLPPFRIWVFGSLMYGFSTEIQREFDFLKFVGPSSESDIDSAIIESDGVVLPIWEGGGSNLKTAQALLSGKAVLGSKYAFRGFEEFSKENGVSSFEEAEELLRALLVKPANATFARPKVERAIDWTNVLAPLPDLVQSQWDRFNQKRVVDENLL